jgi:menaquinone-9 beta-reductase
MTASYDVAVVGAGPAGTAAAIAAARSGARVALFERSAFPRTKVCGCCLTARAVAELHALGAGAALDGARELRSVRVACGAGSIELRREAGVAIGRDVLDTRLVAIAREAGVEVFMECHAQVLAAGAIAATPRDGDTHTIEARTIIAADGLAGASLDACDGFRWTLAPSSHMGFGATVPAHAIACEEGEIRLRVSDGGYIGSVRLPDGTVDIAAAVDPRRLRDAGNVATCALGLLGSDVRDEGALLTARWKGTPQLTRRRARVAARGILVVGDAAGYVEPFTGEGMTWAITTGRAAGELAAGKLTVGAREPHLAWPAMHARLVGGSRLRCRLIARALRSPLLVRSAIGLGGIARPPLEWLASSIGREVPA